MGFFCNDQLCSLSTRDEVTILYLAIPVAAGNGIKYK